MSATRVPLTPDFLLAAYANGYFPMAQSRHDPQLYWFHPERRGILPLERFHIPRRLARFLRGAPFRITTNQAFGEVMLGCAQRQDTWINDTILTLYHELHRRGHAHSIECWHGDMLAGGVYGVALGGAFFGESMFSRRPNASKAALAHLVSLLRESGYTLLDTQYVNAHLTQFGVEEIPCEDYMRFLDHALTVTPKPCF